SSSTLDGLGFQHADLREHPGEVIDAILPHDLAILELVQEYRVEAERLPTGREAQESPDVGHLDAEDLHHEVAIDHEAVGSGFHVEKRIEHTLQDLLDDRAAGVRA